MTRPRYYKPISAREEIVLAGIVLLLLYATAAITSALYASKIKEVYEPACTEIHKADSSPRGCE